jgi:hypothetical protein
MKLIPARNITAAKIWNFIQKEEKPVELALEVYKLVPKKAARHLIILEMLSG